MRTADAPTMPRQNSALTARKSDGFSLIELMIAVAILGILAAIALPQFELYRIRATRDAAKAVLLEIVSKQEQYASSRREYFETTTANTLDGLKITLPEEVLAAYDITITRNWVCIPAAIIPCPPVEMTEAILNQNPTILAGFIATAAPKGRQANDGNLVINQFGLRTRTLGGATSTW